MKLTTSMSAVERFWHQFQRSLRFQSIVAILIAIAVVSQSAIAQSLDSEGIRFPANPAAENTAMGSGCHEKSDKWGLTTASRYGGTGTKTSPYKYVLHNDQAVEADNADEGGIHFPRWCGDILDTDDGTNPGAYTLVRSTGTNTFTSISDDATLIAQLEALNGIADGEAASIVFAETAEDTRDTENLVAASATIDGEIAITGETPLANLRRTPIRLPLILEYNPPGAEKKFFYAVLEIRSPPPVSPEIPDTSLNDDEEIEADSSVGFRVSWDNHTDARSGTDDVGANIVCIENGRRSCEMETGDIVEIEDDNSAETTRSKTFILDGVPFRSEASMGQKVVVGYRPGAKTARTGAYTDQNTGWSEPKPIEFKKSIELDPMSVGSGDAKTLNLFPAEDVTEPDSDDAVFHFRTNADWLTRLGTPSATNVWKWKAASSNNAVATVRMNADTDTNITDDTLTITGVYSGTAARATATITVTGTQETAENDGDPLMASGDMLVEVIKVTVLKNRAPIFSVTDATVSWPEHADSDYSISLVNSFVASGFISDEDAMQSLSFNFLDDDGNVIAASGNDNTSKSSTGFQVQTSGDDAGKITAQYVNNRSQVSFERYANGEVILNVQASDGHGGTDVLELTIQVQDENDKPYPTTTKFSHAALVDSTGARTANVNLTTHFRDEDDDRLCYRIKPDSKSSNFDTHATVSLAGAATCHLPRLTLTMKSALTQGTPGVGNPIAGKSGVEEISVDVDVYESVQEDPKNPDYSDAKTLTFKLVYGANLAPVVWGGRVTDTTNFPYLSRHTIKEHTHFSMVFSAQDVQPVGDEVCFELKGPDAARFEITTAKCPTRGNGDTFKVTVTSTEKKCPNPKRPECFMDHESTGGSVDFTLEAKDLSGGVHALPFRLILEDVEESPYLAVPIKDQFAVVGSSPLTIDLSEHFRDDDSDDRNLAYTVNSSSRHVTVSRQGSIVTLTVSSAEIENSVRSLIDVKATDSDGNSAFSEFNVKLRNENAPPRFDNGITAVTYSVDENSTKGTLIGAGETATDPDDGDTVTYSFLGGGGGLFKVNASTAEIMVDGPIDFETTPAGGHEFTVAATDDYGSAGYLEVNIVVRDLNEAPMFVKGSGEIPDVTVLEGLRMDPCIMASDYFTDPDARDRGAGLLITALSSRRSIATVSVVNNEQICVVGVDPGTGPSTVTVTAEDRGGLSIKKRFMVTVAQNLPPTLARDIPDQSVQESGESVDIDLDEFFDDGDARSGHAERITYALTISDVTVATATIVHGSMLRIYGDSVGTSAVTVTATDQAGGTAMARFNVRVERNEPPTVGQVADVTHRLGLGPATVDISNAFRDDGDTFKIVASTADPSVATASVVNGEDGFQLRVHAYGAGMTTATLTAIDSGGNEVSTKLLITIDPRNDPPRVGSALRDTSLRADSQLDIELSDAFIDEDDLTYTVDVEDDAYADIFVRDGVIRVYGIAPGTTQVAITATDTLGQLVTVEFELTVLVSNTAPVVTRSLGDVNMFVGDVPVEVSLRGLFSDEQDSVLNYMVSSDDDSVATVSLGTSDNGDRAITIKGVGGGRVTITVTATDSSGASVSAQFMARVTMNYAPVVNRPLEDLSLYTGADMLTVDISDTFSDADGETLSLALTTDNDAAAMVELVNNDTALRITTREGGTVVVTLVATDRAHKTAMATFSITVTVNNPPMLANALEDVSFYVDDDPLMIGISNTFSDPDDEVLTLSVVSADESIATAKVVRNGDGSVELEIKPHDGGEVSFTLTATDRAGKTVSDSFMVMVKVNTAPVVVKELADATLTLGTPINVRIDDVFEDPDAEDDVLAFSASSSNMEVATVSISDGMLKIDGVAHGSAMVTVTATDHRNASATDEFGLTVKTAPMVADAAKDLLLSMQIGGDVLDVNVGEYFVDADGDALTYTYSLTGDAVTYEGTAAGKLSLTPNRKGSAEIATTATDPGGRSASFTVNVNVSDSNMKAAADLGLAGYGRTVISSVSSAIGSRVESNRSDAGVAVTKYVPVKRRQQPVATTPAPRRPPAREAVEMPTPQQPTVATPRPTVREQPRVQSRKNGVSWNTLGSSSSRRGNDNNTNRFSMSDLVPKNFSQNLNGDGGVGSWSVWGTADSQNFEGTDYDGSATNAYVGVDVKTMNSLLLGAAVSRNSGSFDYSSGNAEQKMDVEVTSVLPYFAYEPNRKSLVWGVIGGGRGSAETTVVNSEKESSDLSLFTGVFGGRMTVAQSGSLQLGVRGDFAYADMSTENGSGAADELSAAVNRARVGLEGSYTQVFGGGGALTPYGEVSVRNDGGDGVTGTGVEVAGGFRFGSEKLRVELSGRTLAMHSEDDYKESGISLMAVLNSSALGTGLSFSLTPSWGSSSQSSQAIWAERAALNAGQRGQSMSGLNGRALEARLGYGIPIINDRYLLTPYLDYRTDDTDTESMSLGASLTQLIYDTSEFDMSFELGRLDDGVERPSNQFGLTAEMSF